MLWLFIEIIIVVISLESFILKRNSFIYNLLPHLHSVSVQMELKAQSQGNNQCKSSMQVHENHYSC
jgi:hypothetical protein